MVNIVNKLSIMGFELKKLNSWAYSYYIDSDTMHLVNTYKNEIYRCNANHTVACEACVIGWTYTDCRHIDEEKYIILKDGTKVRFSKDCRIVEVMASEVSYWDTHTIVLIQLPMPLYINALDFMLYDAYTKDILAFRIEEPVSSLYELGLYDGVLHVYGVSEDDTSYEILKINPLNIKDHTIIKECRIIDNTEIDRHIVQSI